MNKPAPLTRMTHAAALREGTWAEVFYDEDFDHPVLVAYDADVVKAAYRALNRKQLRYVRVKRLTDYLARRLTRPMN